MEPGSIAGKVERFLKDADAHETKSNPIKDVNNNTIFFIIDSQLHLKI
jgi:hypothetical protein